MKKLKEYKVIIIIGLVILSGAFYWSHVRPVQVRKSCTHTKKILPAYISDEQYKDLSFYNRFLLERDMQEKPSQPTKEFIVEATEKEYNSCLREHGL